MLSWERVHFLFIVDTHNERWHPLLIVNSLLLRSAWRATDGHSIPKRDHKLHTSGLNVQPALKLALPATASIYAATVLDIFTEKSPPCSPSKSHDKECKKNKIKCAPYHWGSALCTGGSQTSPTMNWSAIFLWPAEEATLRSFFPHSLGLEDSKWSYKI